MKKIPILFFLLFSVTTLYAQNVATTTSNGIIYLYPNESKVEVNNFKRGSYSGSHILGEEIDKQLNEFEQNYVYYKKGEGAYAVEEKHVLKPTIYKAVNRVVKHYTKQFKKGRVPAEEAKASIVNALKVGNMLIRFQTEKVEYDLDRVKSVSYIEKYLDNIQFKE